MPSNQPEPDQPKTVAEQRQAHLMTAAARVFSRLGYAHTTMANVAAEAGVAVGTIYNYFPSKRDLLEALAVDYVIAPLREIVADPPASEMEFLVALMENRLNLGLTDASRFVAMINELHRDPALRRRYAEKAVGPILRDLEDYVRQRVENGTFREFDPALLVRAVAGMFVGFVLVTRMEGDKTPVDLSDPARVARAMAEIVLDGIRCR